MAIWSSLSRSFQRTSNFSQLFKPVNSSKLSQNVIAVRNMSGHGPKMFTITPSRFQWHKFKDMFHFYVLLGAIPCLAVVFYANVFIGPAQLTEIPEGYVPKHWEYHRHPISRFIARYIQAPPQQQYEKCLHVMYEENEKAQIRKLEQRIRDKMAERNDYIAWYYRPAIGKYYRVAKETADTLEEMYGD
uniref:NADH dehydrogenase [ubiquinone] 1 beta subcomplex subunit 5, mitochondrial n=1 Tax=Corethrella appendiculata TaxID=1370023 RepID=U5ERB1_9DIPT